jgi:diguanylate cyclase (GGDEF)-like protein
MPGFQSLEWIDKEYYAQWVIPKLNNAEYQNRYLAYDDVQFALLERAKYRRTPSMSDMTLLAEDEIGFFVYFPIFIKGEFDGFFLAIFNADHWLDYVLSIQESEDEQRNYRISIESDHKILHGQPGWDSVTNASHQADTSFSILGHQFTVHCRPTDLFYLSSKSYLKEIVGIAGVLMSILIVFVVHLFFKTSLEAWRAKTAKASMQEALDDLVSTQDELEQTYSSLQMATNAGRIGIWAWRVGSDRLKWNDLMFFIHDIPDDVVPTFSTWRRLIHPDDLETVEVLFQQALRGEAVFDTEYRIQRISNEIRYIHTAGRVERDETGAPLRMTGVNWDITERKIQEEKIKHLASHDTLTNLPNLALVQERAALALQLAERNKIYSGLMFIDLDGFKSVNDNYGHEAGDTALIEVSKRLKAQVRKSDTVGRIGGDEFLIILTELANPQDPAIVAKKIIDCIDQPISYNGNLLSVGCSIGIAVFPVDGTDVEMLLKKSDDAMYQVKRNGKNSFTFISDVLTDQS